MAEPTNLDSIRDREPFFDPYDWRIHEDPYPFYARLREKAPVYHNEERDFFALSRHADVLSAFRDPELFSNAQGVSLERDVREARAVMSFLAIDPPEHGRLRALVSSGFTPRRVRAQQTPIRNLAHRYIDDFVEKGQCDFIEEFAGRLPMDVVSEMLGVPAPDRDALRAFADLVVHREEGNPAVPQAGMEAAAELLRYFAEHVNKSRANPEDDLTGALIKAEIEGDRLADTEIIAFLFLMIIAGNETTTKLLANALYWLSKNPGERSRVEADPKLIASWVEETLRYDPSSQLLARTTTRELTLHGTAIPKGARVALLVGSGNRDERVFPSPDRFDITRNTTASLAFGQGPHFCLGASLARLESCVALECILERLPDWQLPKEGRVRIHSSNVRGFAHFPIAFQPGPRRSS